MKGESVQERTKATHVLKFDVMLGDRYVCTLRYPYNPLFILRENELSDFVISKRPTLKGKDFRIAL